MEVGVAEKGVARMEDEAPMDEEGWEAELLGFATGGLREEQAACMNIDEDGDEDESWDDAQLRFALRGLHGTGSMTKLKP